MVKVFVLVTFIIFHLCVHGLASASDSQGIVSQNRQLTNSEGARDGASALNALIEEANNECREFLDDQDDTRFNQCIDSFLSNPSRQEEIQNAQKAYARDNELNQTKNFKSETTRRLEEKLEEKTTELLRGESKDKFNQQIVNHEEFYRLYETQLAKSVTLVINSYCMYADGDNSFVLYKPTDGNKDKRKGIVNRNFQRTTEASTDSSGQPALATFFMDCLKIFSNYCSGNVPSADSIDSFTEEDRSYTERQACLVSSQLRKLNKTITRNFKISNNSLKRGDIEKEFSNTGFQRSAFSSGLAGEDFANALQFFDPNQPGVYDKLTSLTGQEFSDVATGVANAANNCQGSINNLQNNTDCAGFLRPSDVIDKESRDNIRVGSAIQTGTISRGIASLNEETFMEQLEVDGYTASVIEQNESNIREKLEDMKLQLKNKYEKERQAALNEFLDKIKEEDPNSPQQENSNVAQIEVDRAKEINSLILFNNFVAGYLCVGDNCRIRDAQKTYNLSAIEADIELLEESGVDFFSGVNGQRNIDRAKDVFNSLNDSSRSPSSDNGASTLLNPQDVNCSILKDYENTEFQRQACESN